ncbi:prepilin-type N-terminal cleavage/methylation domain-containing protein [Candidatus Gracilibacteria bacterium]|nr:prepilin-type N-terminal cleavage/methylation domain-containing protein [Candidatus Gracilibacteria bacterium]
MKKLLNKGFTLVEVLLVVVIIAILAGVVIVAINPGRQISQANNTQRSSDVRAVLDAVSQYAIDNRGALPTTITLVPTAMGSAAGLIDVCADIVPTYTAAMPYDPTAAGAHFTSCADYATGYNISKNATGRVTVSAPSAELTATISVTK